MALFNCSECGKEISDKSEVCLHCGCPVGKMDFPNEIINNNFEVEQEKLPNNFEVEQANYSDSSIVESNKSRKYMLNVIKALMAICIIILVYYLFQYFNDNANTTAVNQTVTYTTTTSAPTTITTTTTTKTTVAKTESKAAIKSRVRSLVRVSELTTSQPNSAGGVDLQIKWLNKSKKIIKYISFTVVPYNAVNDIVTSEVGNKSYFSGQCTGPFKYNVGSGFVNYDGDYIFSDDTWNCAWYNSTIKYAGLISIDIDYMDGTSIEIPNSEVGYALY